MTKDNNFIKALKNNVMLNCDSATLLITKSDFVKLKCSERIKLQMHLASCKLCRRFKVQSKIISTNIQNISHPDNNQFAHKLSTEQKKNLSRVIQDNLNN